MTSTKNHAMKLIFLSTLLLLAATQSWAKTNIDISGKIVQVLDNGEKVDLPNKRLRLEENTLEPERPVDERNHFRLYQPQSKLHPGQKVKITINDNNLFILSPMNGEFFLPNTRVAEMDVVVVSKQSRLYHSLSKVITGYSIQVALTHHEGAAVELVRSLKRDKYDAYYNAYPISGIPSNGYFYKVRVRTKHNIASQSAYEGLEQAISLKKSLKKRYGRFDDSFIVIDTEAKDS